MKKILVLLALFFGYTSMAQKQFVVDANAVARTIEGSFTRIKVSGAINLYLSQAEEERMAVSASEERFMEGIKTEIKGNTLHIYYDGDGKWGTKNKKLKVYASFKNLESLQASGACNVLFAGTVKVPKLSIDLSGASDLDGHVDIQDLSIESSGASDARLSGTVTNLVIDCSGASDVKAYEMIAENCSVDVSGASDVHITVNKQIKGNASGASSVYYKGTPQVKEVHSSGASSFASRNG